jgi:hypothetical protein
MTCVGLTGVRVPFVASCADISLPSGNRQLETAWKNSPTSHQMTMTIQPNLIPQINVIRLRHPVPAPQRSACADPPAIDPCPLVLLRSSNPDEAPAIPDGKKVLGLRESEGVSPLLLAGYWCAKKDPPVDNGWSDMPSGYKDDPYPYPIPAPPFSSDLRSMCELSRDDMGEFPTSIKD